MLYTIVSILMIKKGHEQMKVNNTREIYDNITGYGIFIRNDRIFLVKNGKEMRLDALIIKEKRGN